MLTSSLGDFSTCLRNCYHVQPCKKPTVQCWGPLRASSPTSSLTPSSGRSLCWLYKGKKEISIYGVLTVYLTLDIGPERVSDVRKVTQQSSDRPGTQTKDSSLIALLVFLHCTIYPFWKESMLALQGS